ncbi:MAG: hypothetical protein RL095_2251 [Verrucomicrobiota bacterium]|jgi:outer membrane protein TolC
MKNPAPLALLLLASCASYEAAPLVNQELLEANQKRQAPLLKEKILDFDEALRFAAINAPELRRAQAEYEAAAKLAGIKTPWPNPELELAPSISYGSGADKPGPRGRIGALGSLMFTLPLNGRLGLQDEVNAAEAEALRVKAVASQRRLGLELRRLWRVHALSRQAATLKRELAESARAALAAERRANEAGIGSRLDSGINAIEALNLQREAAAAEIAAAEVAGQLAVLTGLPLAALDRAAPEMPPPAALPPREQWPERIATHNPELAILRAEYEVAERQLRLEVALQYPDLRLGTSVEGMAGEHKADFGLSLGLDLPIFDRNQQGIAVAEGQRNRLRRDYESRLAELLNEAETQARCQRAARASLELARQALPQSRRNLEDARQNREAGRIDLLRQLEVERSARQSRLALVADEVEVMERLNRLEAILGLGLEDRPEAKPPH